MNAQWFSIKKAPKVATIEMVHKDFDDAEGRIMKEVDRVLSQDVDELKVKKLNALGFVNSKGFKEGKKQMTEQAEMDEIAEHIRAVKLKFPAQRVITYREATRVCKKYGLVFTPSEKFTGEIPTENVDEMIEFANTYLSAYESDQAGTPRIDVESRVGDAQWTGDGKARIQFFIAATPDLVDMKGMEMDEAEARYKLPDPDPIAMVRFRKQNWADHKESVFLIISKWGDEADIKEFHNKKEN